MTDQERLAAAREAFLDLCADSNIHGGSDEDGEYLRFDGALSGDTVARLIAALGIPRASLEVEEVGYIDLGTMAAIDAAIKNSDAPSNDRLNARSTLKTEQEPQA